MASEWQSRADILMASMKNWRAEHLAPSTHLPRAAEPMASSKVIASRMSDGIRLTVASRLPDGIHMSLASQNIDDIRDLCARH